MTPCADRSPRSRNHSHLHSDFGQIVEEIQGHKNAKKKIKKRPLLKDFDQARALFEERLPLYRGLADHEIQVGGRSIDEVVDDITQITSKWPR